MSSDEVRDLADRVAAKQARGEEWEFEADLELAGFTKAEQEEYTTFVDQRTAHASEKLEALTEDVRIVKLLFAYEQGAITPRASSSSGSAARCPTRWRSRSRRAILSGRCRRRTSRLRRVGTRRRRARRSF
jgi:hypothetical protein